MFKNNLRLLLNALAFANVGNQSEFRHQLEQLEHPESNSSDPFSTATPLPLGRRKAAEDSSHNLAKR